MKILKTIAEFNDYKKYISGDALGFIPTMGALHKGHASLFKTSVEQNEKSLVSIFINPKQFNDEKDFLTYPKTLDEDLALCSKYGIDSVFIPQKEEIFLNDESITLKDSSISSEFEGKMRPGHFDGVLLILLKLLNLVRADAIYMGEKDYQQALLTQKLCKTFFIPTQVKIVKTYRDSTGLPYSSRNTKLTPEGLEQAQTVAKMFHQSTNEAEFMRALKSSMHTKVDLDYYGELGEKILMAHKIEDVRILDNKDKKK